MLKWYQEPFLHFIILGTILFFIMHNNDIDSSENIDRVIVVNQEDISKVLTFWDKEHNSRPSKRELESLLREYKQDDILYQEAILRDLDKDDRAIKKLLVDKLKYTISDSVNIAEVSSDVLKEYFNKNRDKFAKESQINLTFGHVYLNPQEHTNIDADAEKLLKDIKSLPYTNSISRLGDKFYAGNYFDGLSKKELSKSFSRFFIEELIKLPENRWSLLKSGYGVHLVYMVDVSKKDVFFKDVKEHVKRAYIIEKNRNAYKLFFNKIKEKYKILIEENKSKVRDF